MALTNRIFISVLLLALFTPVVSLAQESPRVYLERVGAFGVRVLVDSAMPVNAYNVVIEFNDQVAGVDRLDTSDSLITVFPKPAHLEGKQLIIRGGSTTAFSGTGGELATIYLRPISEGRADVTVVSATVYRADGLGTPEIAQTGALPLSVTPGTFTAYEESRQIAGAEIPDREPPAITTIEITENPLQYGERLVIFQAQDEGSGISRFEARERAWVSWSNWRLAENPYPVDTGSWAIQLRAVDNYGNEAFATVYQLGNAIWKAGVLILATIGAVMGIIAVLRRKNPRYTK